MSKYSEMARKKFGMPRISFEELMDKCPDGVVSITGFAGFDEFKGSDKAKFFVAVDGGRMWSTGSKKLHQWAEDMLAVDPTDVINATLSKTPARWLITRPDPKGSVFYADPLPDDDTPADVTVEVNPDTGEVVSEPF